MSHYQNRRMCSIRVYMCVGLYKKGPYCRYYLLLYRCLKVRKAKNLFSGFRHIQYECVPNYVITVFQRHSELTAHFPDDSKK